jgi:hypothetical protein
MRSPRGAALPGASKKGRCALGAAHRVDHQVPRPELLLAAVVADDPGHR